jgi:eukaryotic-like serine/threonine-protein kinase
MNYRRLAVLHETDTWRIWRGEHPSSRRCFTIKEARRGASVDGLRTQLATEYALFSQLNHPNILRPAMLDLDRMRLVFDDTRSTLAQLLQQAGSLEPDQVASVLMQCLQGLAYLHEQNLAHGSLGMRTIFLGQAGEVKLADFHPHRFDEPGAAAAWDPSIRHLPPEMLGQNRGDLTPSSDLYCLGFVGLEMLHGAEFERFFGLDPAISSSQASWVGWHADLNRRLSIVGEQPETSRGLLQLIEAMIEKVPAQRVYLTAAEAIAQLRVLGLGCSQNLPGMGGEEERPAIAASGAAAESPASEEPATDAGRKTKMARDPGGRGRSRGGSAGPSITLTPLAGGGSCQFPAADPILIGRADGCELNLADENASKKHAMLSYHPDGWWLFDLRSRSGTTCNDRQVGQVRLLGGEELQFGSERWNVSIGQARPRLRRGRFELRDLLHSGGNGELWRAVWLDRNFRVVALRIYPPEFELDEEQVKRFLRGIEEGAAIHHANVLRLYWAGTWRKEGEQTWYLAMEYMAGGSLRDRLVQGRRPIGEVVRYALDVAAALTEAARLHVLHRNINPSCILFDSEGSAKLGDFSLMRLEVLESIQQITQARAPLGEQIYQAPEVVRGDRQIGAECDLYSLAATMYEALSGRPVVPRGLTLPDTLNAICNRAVVPLRALTPSVPEDLAWLVQRCLDKDPAKRLNDPEEFRDRLGRVQMEP